MILQSILMEVRRKLQCSNVFLNFAESLNKSTDSVVITLEPEKICLKINGASTIINIGTHFHIVPNSVSALLVKENYMSFRINIKTSDEEMQKIIQDTPPPHHTTIFNSELKISQNDLVQLICSNCDINLLTMPKKFSRILELPSGSLDMSDWFCHKSTHTTNTDLTPKIDDIFYGFYFIVINVNNCCNIRYKDKYAYCQRCLQFFGETTFHDKALKLWNEHIFVQSDLNKFQIFFNSSNTNNGKEYYLISEILSQSHISDDYSFINFEKILFESVFPNRERNYLMVNIMEKNLELLKNLYAMNLDKVDISLEKRNSFKALFKTEQDNEQPLLNFWRNDLNVHQIEISHKVFSSLSNCLMKNSLLIPEEYRYSNGFLLTYVFE